MANDGLYERKDMMPNLFSTETAFRAGRFMGRELDHPAIDEIIRPAKVKGIDPEKKLVSLEWLDVPGAQVDVLLNFPGVGRDWGIYFCPQINDWCTCAIERGRVRILSWVPRNVRRLKLLQPGEVMIESAAQASIFFPQSGGLTISASPEKDNKPVDASIALDNPYNIPTAMINLGLKSPFSSDKVYEAQIFGQHGDNIFYDGLGNASHYTSRNKTVRITGNLFTSIGMSDSQYVRKYRKIEVENDQDEMIRCAGVKHWYKLDVLKDFINNVGAGYLKKIGTLQPNNTNGKEDGMEKDPKLSNVYWVSHVKITSPSIYFYWGSMEGGGKLDPFDTFNMTGQNSSNGYIQSVNPTTGKTSLTSSGIAKLGNNDLFASYIYKVPEGDYTNTITGMSTMTSKKAMMFHSDVSITLTAPQIHFNPQAGGMTGISSVAKLATVSSLTASTAISIPGAPSLASVSSYTSAASIIPSGIDMASAGNFTLPSVGGIPDIGNLTSNAGFAADNLIGSASPALNDIISTAGIGSPADMMGSVMDGGNFNTALTGSVTDLADVPNLSSIAGSNFSSSLMDTASSITKL